MAQTRFEIVFKKLEEEMAGEEMISLRPQGETSPQELEEIEELRRVVAEVLEQPLTSYTTT
jgi:hypothetical protein